MPRITFEAETDLTLMQMVRAYWYGTPEGQQDLIQIGHFQAALKAQNANGATGDEQSPDEDNQTKPSTKPKTKRKSTKKTATKKAAAKKDEEPEQEIGDSAADIEDDQSEDDAPVDEPGLNDPPSMDYMRAMLMSLSAVVPGATAMKPVMDFSDGAKKGKLVGIPEDKRAAYVEASLALIPKDKLDDFHKAMSDAGFPVQ